MQYLRTAQSALLTGALLVSAAAIAGCASSGGGSSAGGGTSSSASGKGAYNIAVISDLTGGDSAYGAASVGGAQAAAKAINAAGGVNGHKLALQVYDAQSDTAPAIAAVRQAASAHPAVITGFIGSAESAATEPIIAAAQIPVLSETYPSTQTNADSSWFALSPSPDQVATGLVNGLKAVLGGSLQGKKIAFAGLVSPAVDTNLAALKTQVAAAGGAITTTIRDPITFSSWTSQAANVVSAHVDAIAIIQVEANVVTIGQALGVAGFKSPIVVSEASSSDETLSEVNLPNMYGVREGGDALPGSALYEAGVSAGVSATAIANSEFPKAYASMYTIADILGKCGYPCSADQFAAQAKDVTSFDPPNGALLGPVDLSDGQNGFTAAALFQWNAAEKKSLMKGAAFSLRS